MALKQNGLLSGAPVRFLSGTLATIRGSFGGDGSKFACFVGGFHQTTGIPAGYRPPASFVMPIKDGGISSFTTAGQSTTAVTIEGRGVLGGVAIEGSLNLRQLMKAMAAVLLGESTDGNTTFKAANNDAVTRVTGAVDGSGNRTSVTLNLGD